MSAGEPSRPAVVAGQIALAFALLVTWEATAVLGLARHLATPTAIFRYLAEAIASDRLVGHVVSTMRLALVGLGAGGSAGVVLPLLLTRSPRLLRCVEPYLAASASVPKYALLPLLILWLGIDDAPRVSLVALLVFYPVAFGVLAGMRDVDMRLLVTVRVLGAGRMTALRLVIWPSMIPFLFAALKIAVPRAVSAAVVAELLVADEGVGFLIRAAQENLDVTGVLAAVVVTMVLVVVMTAAVNRFERRVLAWRPAPPPA